MWQYLKEIFSWIYFFIFFIPYLLIIIAIYYHAESRGESGFFWAIFCVVAPGLGPIIYLTWVLILYSRNRKRPAIETGVSAAKAEVGTERLSGSELLTKGKYTHIDELIKQGRWQDADTLVRAILKDAENSQDGPTIADMIGYMDRIKKRKKG
jgi:hypothetical protein